MLRPIRASAETLFSSHLVSPRMSGIRGDVGARQLIGTNEDVLCEIEIGGKR